MTPIELAEEVTGVLGANVRKVLAAAADNGWALHGSGATFCIRLDHPSDDLAVPVFVTWQLAPSEKTGKLSWRFMSAGTATLHQLNSKDVLTYLADPTVIYPEASE